MKLFATVQSLFDSLPLATRTLHEQAPSSNASIESSYGSEVSLILLGCLLLAAASLQFIRELCKSLAENANK